MPGNEAGIGMDMISDAGVVDTGDLKLAYRLEGPRDAPIIMFSNSLMADYSMWDGNVSAFTDRYRVLRYDTRGHGGTRGPSGPWSIADLTGDVVALLDALELERVHFVGLSLGGIIGQRLAACFPQRLLSLALCDTSCDNSAARAGWQERIALVRDQGVGVVVEATLQRWFTPDFFARAPRQIEEVREMLLRADAQAYMLCASVVADVAQTELLSRIVAPTLIVVGRHDMACTVEHAMTIQSHITGSELAIIESAAHLPNIEQAAIFNATIRAFVDV